MRAASSLIRSIHPLRHHALAAQLAGVREHRRPDLAVEMFDQLDRIGRLRQQLRQPVLACVQRFTPDVATFIREQIEGEQLDLIIMPARLQPVEIGHAARVEPDRLGTPEDMSSRCVFRVTGLLGSHARAFFGWPHPARTPLSAAAGSPRDERLDTKKPRRGSLTGRRNRTPLDRGEK
jgi:hypothetical protein